MLHIAKCILKNPSTDSDFIDPSHDEKTLFDVRKLTQFQLLSVITILRPDQFLDEVSSFVGRSLGEQYTVPSVFDLQDFYAESHCRTPLMFILSPGKMLIELKMCESTWINK